MKRHVATRIAQRFAIDWLQVGPNGRPVEGDEKANEAYSGYGNEVLAVADGVVAATKDGIPENIPGLTSRAVPITLETIGGNHVILDVGGGRFAFYAHMQPGSLRVKVGEKVRRGQVLGLVGNSGNSTAPHLHFHLADANSPLESEGLPYVLESFEQLAATNMWERRQSELPLQNARVRFPVGDATSIDQSTRIAFVGSVRIARIAGSKLPERLIPNTATTETPSVAGSIGDTPASKVRIALPA